MTSTNQLNTFLYSFFGLYQFLKTRIVLLSSIKVLALKIASCYLTWLDALLKLTKRLVMTEGKYPKTRA